MIESILPEVVAVQTVCTDIEHPTIFAEERKLVERAVNKRIREFETGRWCAHRAMELLGERPVPIVSGLNGEPLWPDGLIGSITHCLGFRGSAVARRTEVLSIGIDAEPNEQLPAGVVEDVALANERQQVRELAQNEPSIAWDRLIFSAKESVYKAWFPLMGRWLGFEDVSLTIAANNRTIAARILVPGPIVAGERLQTFTGHWMVRNGLILTSVCISEQGTSVGAEVEYAKDAKSCRNSR